MTLLNIIHHIGIKNALCVKCHVTRVTTAVGTATNTIRKNIVVVAENTTAFI